MAACDRALTTHDILLGIFSHLSHYDFSPLRVVCRTWRDIIDFAPILRRVRCLRPLGFEDPKSMLSGEGKWAVVESRNSSGMDRAIYVAERGIKFHPEVQAKERLVMRTGPRQFWKINIYRTGERSRQLKAAHRYEYLSFPPITTLFVTLEILKAGTVQRTEVSRSTMLVKSGIRIDDVMNVMEAMYQSQVKLNDQREGRDRYECRVDVIGIFAHDRTVFYNEDRR